MDEEHQSLRVINAQLRYYLHIQDPDSLPDDEWAALYRELEWLRTREAKG